MNLEGIIHIRLRNGKTREYLSTKETFVTLNSFLRNPETSKNKIKAGNDVILIADIESTEWEGADE